MKRTKKNRVQKIVCVDLFIKEMKLKLNALPPAFCLLFIAFFGNYYEALVIVFFPLLLIAFPAKNT